MTDDKPRRRNNSTIAFYGIMAMLAMLIVGGYVLVGMAGEQTGDGTVPATHTPQNTIAIKDAALMQDERTNEVGYTTTPVPDFAATQRVLGVTITAQVVEVEKRMAQVTTTAEARAIEKDDELHGYAVSEAQVHLQGAINTTDYEDDLHQQVISHTVEMNAVELDKHTEYLEWMNVVNLVWASAWRTLVLVLAVGLCGFIGWRVYNAYDDERWESTERLEAELERIRKAEEYEQVATEKAVKVAKLLVFIHDAIRVNGEDDNQIPPNTKMDGWNAERWSECVQILKENRLVEIFRGGALQGTFYKRGTLGDLRDELESGNIPSPTSRAEAARVRYVGRMRDSRNTAENGIDERNAR